jgi:hypothetical protein
MRFGDETFYFFAKVVLARRIRLGIFALTNPRAQRPHFFGHQISPTQAFKTCQWRSFKINPWVIPYVFL